jgi:hypothetical protein
LPKFWNPKKKNPVNKNQRWNPSIKSTRQKRTQVDTTQRRNKSKHSTKILKTGKDPKKGLPSLCGWEVHGWQGKPLPSLIALVICQQQQGGETLNGL